MQSQRINITLPIKVLNDLRRRVPLRKRSKYIAQVLEEKLAKQSDVKKELEASLKANYEHDKVLMKEWSALETEGWPD